MTITSEPLITVLDDHKFGADASRLIAAAQTVLTMQAISGASLTIVLTTDQAVAELNRQFRGVDAPTDILSFPFDDLLSGDADGRYLGDLVVAIRMLHHRLRAKGMICSTASFYWSFMGRCT